MKTIKQIEAKIAADSRRLRRELVLSFVIGWPISVAIIWLVMNVCDLIGIA